MANDGKYKPTVELAFGYLAATFLGAAGVFGFVWGQEVLKTDRFGLAGTPLFTAICLSVAYFVVLHHVLGFFTVFVFSVLIHFNLWVWEGKKPTQILFDHRELRLQLICVWPLVLALGIPAAILTLVVGTMVRIIIEVF